MGDAFDDMEMNRPVTKEERLQNQLKKERLQYDQLVDDYEKLSHELAELKEKHRWFTVEEKAPPAHEGYSFCSIEVLANSKKHGVIKATLNTYGIWNSSEVAGGGIVEDVIGWRLIPVFEKDSDGE